MPGSLYANQLDNGQAVLRCVINAAGDFIFVSPALGRSVGQNAEELKGTPAQAVMRIAGAPKHLAEADSGHYDVALLRGGHDPLLMQARLDRIPAPDGNTLTVISCDREALPPVVSFPEAPVDLRHFLNVTRDLMAVYTPDGATCLRANPAFIRALGMDGAALTATPFSDLIHQDDRAEAIRALQDPPHSAANGDARADFEARTHGASGPSRRIAWTLKSADGHLYVVGRDLTHIRQYEEELRRREQHLAEAEKIGHAGHWCWETRKGGGMKEEMAWSDQTYAVFGVRKEGFVPTLENVRALVLKRDIVRTVRALLHARVRKKDFSFEFRIRLPGGGQRTLRCEGRCRIDPATGVVAAFYGIMQDITERTRHETALRSAKEAAEQAYASKTRFLANMSHELRTPLNAIIGFSEMMQRQLLGPVGNPRYLDYISSIRDSGDHLLGLINDILDMSKIEVGKYALHVEELNVGKVIRLAVHMIEGRAHDARIRLLTDGIEDDIHICADRRALMQVLLNILSNAVKFTKEGGTIDLRCQRELNGVAISVSDTGIGIPADKIALVTRPFEQVDSEYTRAHDGSGLGLAITKDLVELHGGTLHLASEVGVGTTVSVLLPERAVPSSPFPR